MPNDKLFLRDISSSDPGYSSISPSSGSQPDLPDSSRNQRKMTSTGTGKKQPDKVTEIMKRIYWNLNTQDLNRKAISTGDSVIYLQPYEYNLVQEVRRQIDQSFI